MSIYPQSQLLPDIPSTALAGYGLFLDANRQPNWALIQGGVTSLVQGTGISLSGSTGAVTVSNSGVVSVTANTGIATSAASGSITLTLATALQPLATLGTANQITGVNSGATVIEYKSLAADANATVGITHAANSITLESKTNIATRLNITTTPVTLLSTDPEDVWVDLNGGSKTITLSAASTVKYFRFRIYNSSNASSINTCTIQRAGSDNILNGVSAAGTSITLSNGDILEMRSDGSIGWVFVGGLVRGGNSGSGSNSLGVLTHETFQHRTTAYTGTATLANDGSTGSSNNDMVSYWDTSSGSATANLPAIITSGARASKCYVLNKISASNSLIIDANSTQTINGSSTVTLTELGEAICIQQPAGISSSTDWKILWWYKPSAVTNGSDPTITALAAYNTNGLLTQTAADTFTGRTITGTTNQVNVNNGNGVSGNPTLSTPQDIHTGASPTFAGMTLSNDLVFNTVGDTVQIKTGSNGMMGTTAAMTAGTVTVTNSNVLTGDIIMATRVSGAGDSAGITSYSIVNATSFTLNGVATDDGVYAYVIFRPSP